MVECWNVKMAIFKRSYLVLLVLFLVLSSSAAAPSKGPTATASESSENPSSGPEEKPLIGDHYDQRQNGTENYRIQVDGLVLVVAPIEGLLLAGGLPGLGDSNIFGTQEPKPEKPKPEAPMIASKPTIEASEEKPSSAKSSHGSGLRLINLFSPFLRRIQHPHK